jgi:hypothetical protein
MNMTDLEQTLERFRQGVADADLPPLLRVLAPYVRFSTGYDPSAPGAPNQPFVFEGSDARLADGTYFAVGAAAYTCRDSKGQWWLWRAGQPGHDAPLAWI